MLGGDEPDWLAGANCGGCKSRATKRSKRSLQLDSCPPLVPAPCGNAADVTTARLERSLRLGTWQEGKRSVPQATWFLPLLLLFAPLLLLALCAVLHVFLDGWTELPSCQISELADEPFEAALSLGTVTCGVVLSPQRNFRSKRTHRAEVSMSYTTCKILHATNLRRVLEYMGANWSCRHQTEFRNPFGIPSAWLDSEVFSKNTYLILIQPSPT